MQLEEGLVASTFEAREYGDLLRLCQRYFQALGTLSFKVYIAADNATVPLFFPVTMRATPSIGGTLTGFVGSASIGNNSVYGFSLVSATGSATNAGATLTNGTASAEIA